MGEQETLNGRKMSQMVVIIEDKVGTVMYGEFFQLFPGQVLATQCLKNVTIHRQFFKMFTWMERFEAFHHFPFAVLQNESLQMLTVAKIVHELMVLG